ncbi:Uncharacterised protein [Salmonella enterica subsp. enterica serovar Bovismorbificans]|nr:Uncharacterised protein [Salmonella enterica subsp. enterica serovar Bovismorbificans]
MPAPGAAAKFGLPVIRADIRRAIAPDIKLTVWALFVQRFAKPGVLGRSMVKHHIQDDTNTACFRLRDQLVKIIQRAVGRVDSRIICDVITVIHLRRDIKRREPDGVHAESL